MSELDDVLSLFICCKVCNFLFGFIYIDFNFGLFLGCIRRFKDYEKQLPESKGSSFFFFTFASFLFLGFCFDWFCTFVDSVLAKEAGIDEDMAGELRKQLKVYPLYFSIM